MIKMKIYISDIEYDNFIDWLYRTSQEHPEQLGGLKLPAFAVQMIKLLSKEKKNEKVSGILNRHKDVAIPQVEKVLSRVLGPVKVQDMNIECIMQTNNPVTFTIEVSQIDPPYIIENVMQALYKEENGQKIMGEAYTASYDLETVRQYMRGLDYKANELIIARSMSASKPELTDGISRGFDNIGIKMVIQELHFYIK